MMARAIKRIAFSLGMMASVAAAESNPGGNVFFGFDYVLHPIAIKWACQGPREQDLAAFKALIAAFPEDAKRAELQSHIDAMQKMPGGHKSLAQLLGAEISKVQQKKLCDAARPLNVAWLTPQKLLTNSEYGISGEQKAAWAKFWKVAASLQ